MSTITDLLERFENACKCAHIAGYSPRTVAERDRLRTELLTAYEAGEADRRRLDYLVEHTHITESRGSRDPIAMMDESGPRLPNGGDLRGAIDAALSREK